MSITLIKPEKITLNILYLDDDTGALDFFENNVEKYKEAHADSNIDLKVTVCNTSKDAINLLTKYDKHFNVFICDQHMPDKLGLTLILYLKDDYPNLLFVLYSGVGSLNKEAKDRCLKNKILYEEKTEQFSTLIEKIINRVNLEPKSPVEDLYDYFTKEIIEDMENLEKKDPECLIIFGERELKPSQVIFEVKTKSKLGIFYVRNYFDGLKFFKGK